MMNIVFVPVYGYIASAWASVAGYGVIMLLSYWMGQKKYPIQYDLKSLGLYILLAAVLYVIANKCRFLILCSVWLSVLCFYCCL